MFKDKILLITGGTGSFGNAVLQRFLDTNIKEIRIFSRDEKKQDDMRKQYKNSKISFYIGDVRDTASLSYAMNGVDFVFHAAALKQVPACEFFPIEAVKTNILGTENVLNTGIKYGVKKIICLSTDKAAYPVNAMGISKAMMEKTFIAKSRTVESSSTLICGTRYGNVMASRGSVIPLFISQILNKQEITVTDNKMTRFIMSLDEAVDLVMYAFKNANTGDLFIQKSPSCYIGDLAIAIRELFESKSNIKIIGQRHGEKSYEVLMTNEEASRSEDLGQYFRISSDNRDLNYGKYLEIGSHDIEKSREYNSNNTRILSISEIKDKLLSLVEVQAALMEWRNSQ